MQFCLVLIDLHLPDIIASEHDYRDFGIEVGQPATDVFVSPADRHGTIIPKFCAFPFAPALRAHVALHGLECRRHFWARFLRDIRERRPKSHRDGNRVTKLGESSFGAGEPGVHFLHRLLPVCWICCGCPRGHPTKAKQ